jgi:hypothetical protein
MTDIRTYPESAVVERTLQLTKHNFGVNHITRPMAFYNSPYGTAFTWGRTVSYDNTGVGKTVWDGSRKFKLSCVADKNDIAIVSGATPDTSASPNGWYRLFYPDSSQLWDVTLGLNSTSLGYLLKILDFCYLRGAKLLWTPGFYLHTSRLSFRQFGYVDQVSGDYENNVLAFLNALFDSTQTSTLGFTVANHPGLGAIEAGSEITPTTYDNTGTDQAGAQHANIIRLIKQTIALKEVITGPKTTGIKVTDYAGHAAEIQDYLDIHGADCRSQVTAYLGIATVNAADDTFSLSGHSFSDWDQVLCQASDFLDTYAERTKYYVVNVSGNNFQLALTSGGAPISAASTDGIMDVYVNSLVAVTDVKYEVKTTNLCTYSAATNTFTQTSNALSNGLTVMLVGRIGSTTADGGISTYRRYWVRDVVAGVSFKISATLGGAALNVTQNANVKINKSTPALLNGDNGVWRKAPEYTDVFQHHFYQNNSNLYASDKYAAAQSKTLFTHIPGVYIPFNLYKMFGVQYAGTLSVNATTNTFTAMHNINLKETDVVQIGGTTVPAPLSKAALYYPIAIDNVNKTFKLSLTQGGTEIDITSTGTSVTVYTVHPWYKTKTLTEVWNTESNMNEAFGNPNNNYITSALSYDGRKELLRLFMLNKILALNSPNSVDFTYGFEEGNSTPTEYTVTTSSVNGNLKVTLSASASPPATERIVLMTTTQGIAGVLGTDAEKAFDIINTISPTEFELNVPYTGGAVSGVTGIVEHFGHNGAQEFKELVEELTQAKLTIYRCKFISPSVTTLGYALEGIGAWYYDHAGVRHQW